MNPFTVTCVQTDSGPDRAENLAQLDVLLADAPTDTDLIALPEVFAVRGNHEDFQAAAEPVPGPTTEHLGELARRRHAWVLSGSLIERDGSQLYNTAVLLDRAGALRAIYRKIHLFEVHLETGETVRESDTYTAGDRAVVAIVDGWTCGLSICYDLRFPELYRLHAERGAHLLLVPANFTQRTGRDHWEVLLRARAIENQCFVVAPNQCGANRRTGITSYGNSMVVGPWGDVLARADDQPSILTVTLEPTELSGTRARIPVREHRSPGLFAELAGESAEREG